LFDLIQLEVCGCCNAGSVLLGRG